MYKIAFEDKDIVIRLNRDLVNKDELSRFLDYIFLQSIGKNSELTEEQATILAKEIDRNVWKKIQNGLEEG
ncbi:hypothetical protein H8E77_42720 [bacterium]|nr:hypothetical protein [bacterium]